MKDLDSIRTACERLQESLEKERDSFERRQGGLQRSQKGPDSMRKICGEYKEAFEQ